MTPNEVAASERWGWSDGLTKMHWKIRFWRFLGWIFGGYEALALIVVITALLHWVLTRSHSATSTFFAGLLLGITLLGWGIVGLVGGVLADYLGRKKVMLWSVLVYALFPGPAAAENTVWLRCALRLPAGRTMGSEWSTGFALVSKTWPESARAKAAGFLQSGRGWGAFLSRIWDELSSCSPLGPDTWGLMFVIGALPAVSMLYLRCGVDESEKWQTAVRERRRTANTGAAGTSDGKRPLPSAQLFREPRAKDVRPC